MPKLRAHMPHPTLQIRSATTKTYHSQIHKIINGSDDCQFLDCFLFSWRPSYNCWMNHDWMPEWREWQASKGDECRLSHGGKGPVVPKTQFSLDSRGAGSTSVRIFPSPPQQGHYVPGLEELTEFGLPRWLSDKESACQCRRQGFHPWVMKILWRRKWPPTPVFLSGKSYGQRNLAGHCSWGCKESDTTKQKHIMFINCWING